MHQAHRDHPSKEKYLPPPPILRRSVGVIHKTLCTVEVRSCGAVRCGAVGVRVGGFKVRSFVQSKPTFRSRWGKFGNTSLVGLLKALWEMGSNNNESEGGLEVGLSSQGLVGGGSQQL
jgi:hypothetical protein